MSLAAVFDIGGTKTLFAIVHEDGRVRHRCTWPTKRTECCEVIKGCIAQLDGWLHANGLERSMLCGLGVSLPGMVDARNGVLLKAPFLGWENIDVMRMLRELLPELRIICIENDVNACAIGEMHFGIGRGCTDMLWVTVSTGIGGAVVTDGRLLHGAHQLAGEIGHIRVEKHTPERCSCGAMGCLEAHASGSAMTRAVEKACREDENLARRLSAHGLAQDAKGAWLLIEAGETCFRPQFETCGRYLGMALAPAVLLTDPQKVILGGGMASALPAYHHAIMQVLADRLPPGRMAPEVCSTPLGYEAAAIGAAAMVFEVEKGAVKPCLA